MSVPSRAVFTLTGTSAVNPGVDTIDEIARTPLALDGFDCVTIHATLKGNAGGTLDAYLQASPDGINWFDWCHFAQLIAGAAAVTYVASAVRPTALTTITAIGRDASPTIAAGTFLGTDWGVAIRLITVSSAASTAGATQTVIVTATRLAQAQ